MKVKEWVNELSNNNFIMDPEAIKQILDLIEKDEPVEAYYDNQYRCPKCGRKIWWKGNYCENCGQKIKWSN